MKRNNKKGFTIVELVIVIAVIAILAGVLIPTFAGVVGKAKLSAAQQEAANAYKEAYAELLAEGDIAAGDIEANDWKFTFDAEGNLTGVEAPNGFGYTAKVEKGNVVVE